MRLKPACDSRNQTKRYSPGAPTYCDPPPCKIMATAEGIQVSSLQPYTGSSERHQAEDDGNMTKTDGEDYFLSQNPTEVERLSYQHEVIKDYMGGNLVLAPLDLLQPGLQIFDGGTADGLWLRDLKSSIRNSDSNGSTFVGTDIVPSFFPNPSPPSITLIVHDMTTPYPESFKNRFNLVHQRLALPGCGKYPLRSAVGSLITLVKPGGWIQLLEADNAGPGSVGPATKDAFRLLRELFGQMGVDHDYPSMLKGWLIEMGMERVEERVMDVPLGKSNGNKELGEKGARSFGMAIAGVVQYARSASTSFSMEELDNIAGQVESELLDVGAMHRIYAVWGQRPISV